MTEGRSTTQEDSHVTAIAVHPRVANSMHPVEGLENSQPMRRELSEAKDAIKAIVEVAACGNVARAMRRASRALRIASRVVRRASRVVRTAPSAIPTASRAIRRAASP
jgi:N-acetylglutamate synthase/N-acetylornithine aminotransferase